METKQKLVLAAVLVGMALLLVIGFTWPTSEDQPSWCQRVNQADLELLQGVSPLRAIGKNELYDGPAGKTAVFQRAIDGRATDAEVVMAIMTKAKSC